MSEQTTSKLDLRPDAVVRKIANFSPDLNSLLEAQAAMEDWTVDADQDVATALIRFGDRASEVPHEVVNLIGRPMTRNALRQVAACSSAYRRLVMLGFVAEQDQTALLEILADSDGLLTNPAASLEDKAALVVLRDSVRSLQRHNLLAEVFSVERLSFLADACESVGENDHE